MGSNPINVCTFECCVLSGKGVCDGPITLPEERNVSACGVSEFDLEISTRRNAKFIRVVEL